MAKSSPPASLQCRRTGGSTSRAAARHVASDISGWSQASERRISSWPCFATRSLREGSCHRPRAPPSGRRLRRLLRVSSFWKRCSRKLQSSPARRLKQSRAGPRRGPCRCSRRPHASIRLLNASTSLSSSATCSSASGSVSSSQQRARKKYRPGGRLTSFRRAPPICSEKRSSDSPKKFFSVACHPSLSSTATLSSPRGPTNLTAPSLGCARPPSKRTPSGSSSRPPDAAQEAGIADSSTRPTFSIIRHDEPSTSAVGTRLQTRRHILLVGP
mmetsp:Transcript_17516/g.55982  ORF Transcript_17516/g.55982 Transcript_17516/m.55982 type:complete len:272 (-) Transcript_17516:101-916(-)